MIKKSLLFLFLLTMSVSNGQEFTQNNAETKVTFKIKNFGVNVDGEFGEIKIETNFNSNNLEESYIMAEIAVKSIDTGIKSRDEHILEEDYFDEPKHKNILLTSSKIEKNDDGTYQLSANLTIKGTNKPIEIPVTISETGNSLRITANFEINRKDFKVGGGSFIMGKNVKIQVEYSGTK